MKQKKTCYMCDEIATSKEHVPPKCLFPEQEDLPGGIDLRKQLLTVQSCDTHNSKKSHDDEYFLYFLGGCNQINKIGRNHYTSKIRRAIKRNSSLFRKMTKTAVPVIITDVFCIIEIPKVAIRNSPLLQSEIPQFCNEKVEGFGTR